MKYKDFARSDGASRITISCLYAVQVKDVTDVNRILEVYLAKASPQEYQEIETTWNLVNMRFPDNSPRYELCDGLDALADRFGLQFHSGRTGVCCDHPDNVVYPMSIGIETARYETFDLIQSLVEGREIKVPPSLEQIQKLQDALGILSTRAVSVLRINGCICCS